MLKNAKHFAVFGAIAVFSGWAQGQSLIPAPSGVSGYGAPAAQGGYSGPFYSQMGGPQATVPVAPAMAPMPSSLPISAPVPSHHAPMQAGNLGAAAPMAPTANSAGHAVTQAVNVSARGSGSVMQASAGVPGAAPSWVQKVSGTVIEGGYSTMGESLWSDSCDGIAGDCGIQTCESACSHPLWTHFTGVHASLLYLRPRNTDIAYGVPVDGPIIGGPNNNPIQVGSVGVVDFDYDLGFDVGVNFAVTPMTSVFADLMMFDTSTSSSISTTPPNVIRSLVSHPSSTSAATDFLSASADLDMSLDVVDVGIRHLFVGGDYYAVNYIVGARYARWEENFNATFQDNGSEDVSTSIDFDGAGVRLGLEAERQSCHSRLRIYSRASSSFLAGHFTGNYFQGQTFDPSVVSTDWEVGRVVPVLDLEAGAGWTSAGGGVRLSAGYLFSAWFNTVQSEEFIHAVQQNNFIDLGNTMTLDGLRATAELRF